MNRIKFETTESASIQKSFFIPWEWINKDGLVPKTNDLESKAKRGNLNGYLYRKRIAQVPDYILKILKNIKRSEITDLLFILAQEECYVTYFDHWAGREVRAKFYTPKPELSVKKIPEDNNYNNIVYGPFNIEFIGYGDVS